MRIFNILFGSIISNFTSHSTSSNFPIIRHHVYTTANFAKITLITNKHRTTKYSVPIKNGIWNKKKKKNCTINDDFLFILIFFIFFFFFSKKNNSFTQHRLSCPHQSFAPWILLYTIYRRIRQKKPGIFTPAKRKH